MPRTIRFEFSKWGLLIRLISILGFRTDLDLEMIRVKIHTILTLKKILGKREFEVSLQDGSAVKDLLLWMIQTWGDALSSHLFYPKSDRLLPDIRLLVNGRDIQFLNGTETILRDGDEFLMLPILTGG
jgi:sulfur-carrier protein